MRLTATRYQEIAALHRVTRARDADHGSIGAHRYHDGLSDCGERDLRDLNIPVEVVVCPIVREPDGLAMSSRNVYLDTEQRKAATVLYRSLQAAKETYENGERDAEKLRQVIKDVLASEPLAEVQYVSCADYETLEELDEIKEKALLSMAVFIGKTRLIDNFVLG